MMGSFELTEVGRISVDKVATTLMACPNSETEQKLIRVLETMDNYSLGENSLSLNKARMAPLAKFIKSE